MKSGSDFKKEVPGIIGAGIIQAAKENPGTALILLSLGVLATGATLHRYLRKGDSLQVNHNGIKIKPEHTTMSEAENIEAIEGNIDNRAIGTNPRSSLSSGKARGNIFNAAVDPSSASSEILSDVLRQTGATGSNSQSQPGGNMPRP